MGWAQGNLPRRGHPRTRNHKLPRQAPLRESPQAGRHRNGLVPNPSGAVRDQASRSQAGWTQPARRSGTEPPPPPTPPSIFSGKTNGPCGRATGSSSATRAHARRPRNASPFTTWPTSNPRFRTTPRRNPKRSGTCWKCTCAGKRTSSRNSFSKSYLEKHAHECQE